MLASRGCPIPHPPPYSPIWILLSPGEVTCWTPIGIVPTPPPPYPGQQLIQLISSPAQSYPRKCGLVPTRPGKRRNPFYFALCIRFIRCVSVLSSPYPFCRPSVSVLWGCCIRFVSAVSVLWGCCIRFVAARIRFAPAPSPFSRDHGVMMMKSPEVALQGGQRAVEGAGGLVAPSRSCRHPCCWTTQRSSTKSKMH